MGDQELEQTAKEFKVKRHNKLIDEGRVKFLNDTLKKKRRSRTPAKNWKRKKRHQWG
jgi:hypothetical protein